MTTTAAASSATFPSSVSSTTTFDNDVTELTHSLQEIRVNQGLCPQCGTRLYELESKRTGWVRRITKHQRKPIDVPGLVMRGQCLKCTTVLAGGGNDDTMAGISSTEASDHAYAMALASLEEEVEQAPPTTSASSTSNNHNSPSTTATTATAATTVAMALSSPHATYEGSYNDFGQSHGEGVLTWSNGDVYHGSFWNGQRHGEGTLQFAATSHDSGSNTSPKMLFQVQHEFPKNGYSRRNWGCYCGSCPQYCIDGAINKSRFRQSNPYSIESHVGGSTTRLA